MYPYQHITPVNAWDPSGCFDVFAFYSIGFEYDSYQDIWYSPQDCWQREWGYNDAYDQVAEEFINIDTRKVIFNFGGKDWRVQFWKGDYGPTTGGEIGIYYKDENSWVEHYDSVEYSDMPYMSLTLYRGDEKVFERTYDEYWWVNGFVTDGGTNPDVLRIHALITFESYDMRKAFVDAYIKEYGSNNIYFAYDNTWDNTVVIDWE